MSKEMSFPNKGTNLPCIGKVIFYNDAPPTTSLLSSNIKCSPTFKKFCFIGGLIPSRIKKNTMKLPKQLWRHTCNFCRSWFSAGNFIGILFKLLHCKSFPILNLILSSNTSFETFQVPTMSEGNRWNLNLGISYTQNTKKLPTIYFFKHHLHQLLFRERNSGVPLLPNWPEDISRNHLPHYLSSP